MKILCLHGLRHSGDAMKKSMKDLIRKFTKKGIEFDFYTSPIKFIPEKSTETDKLEELNDYFQWWTATRENGLTLEKYDTIEQSLKNVLNKWNSEQYDGILGFSQGSVLTQIFAYQLQYKIIDTYEPKFIILAGASPITDTIYKQYYNNILKYPVAFISGMRDTLVKLEITNNLRKYVDPEKTIFLIHNGGHYVSTSTEIIYPLLAFIENNKSIKKIDT